MNIQQLTKPFLFSTSILLGGLHMSAWVGKDGAFQVQNVRVEGCRFADEKAIRAIASELIGKRIFELESAPVEKRITQMPYVMRVHVARSFPSTIQITVMENAPVALLNSGGLLPIDAAGNVLPRLHAGFGLDLPIVSGIRAARSGETTKLPERAQGLLTFLRELREENNLLYEKISEFHVDGKMNLTVFLMRGGVPVYFGAEEWMKKCDRLQTVLKQLELRAERVAAIDLRFENQVVTKPAA